MLAGAPYRPSRRESACEYKESRGAPRPTFIMSNPSPRPRTPRVLKRAAAICATGSLVVAGAMLGVACILADPPAAIDPPIHRRPMILRETVNPTPTRILRSWPTQFLFYVDADPTLTVAWEVFFDYDRTTHNQVSIPSGQSDPSNDDAGVRPIVVERGPPDATQCHTFEIVVAYGFVDDHVPDNRGGDSVLWFYTPTGDLTTCPIFDASVLDASEDADAGIFVPGNQDGGG